MMIPPGLWKSEGSMSQVLVKLTNKKYRLNTPEGRQGRHHGPRRQRVWWAFGLERWEIGCMAFIFR